MPDSVKKRKVCFVSPAAYPLLSASPDIQTAGGAEAQFTAIGIELSRRGFDVHFVVDEFGQPSEHHIDNISTHKVPLRYLGGSNRHLPHDWLVLFHRLRSIDADIHLLKVPKDVLLPLGVFCKYFNKKLIFVGQSDKDVTMRLLFQLQNRAAVLLYRLGLFFVDCAVAQTSVQLNGFESMGLRCRVIKNAITLPQRHDKKDGYILWVGNGTANKLPGLVPKLARLLPEYHFKMILVNTDRDNDDRRFSEQSQQIPNFEYLGFVPFSRIAEYFSRASLLVNTSLREGFPNVFLQAWQYGTPVVSLHVDPDCVIRKYGLGKLSGSFEKMCQDISHLMENDRQRVQMGKNAQSYVYANHSMESVLSEYTTLFDDLLR